jgi:hypothetical protein
MAWASDGSTARRDGAVREGVVIMTVVDLDMPLPLALVWRRDNTSPLLANFIGEVPRLADVRAVKKG